MVGLIFILLFNIQDTVTATTYKLTAKENGPYGNNMASGYKVSSKHPGNNRVIAVSPDLLKKFPYHTDVLIEGAGKLDGKYKVEDVMSSRWHNRIDILLNWKIKNNKFYNVIITNYGKHQSHSRNSISRTNAIHNVRTKQNYKRIKKHSSKSKRRKYHSAR
jgi:3D (Asp-Asp-Asp) domain-containing protein